MPVIPPILRDAILVCSKGMMYRKDLAPQLFGEGLLDFYRYKAATAKICPVISISGFSGATRNFSVSL